MSTNNSKDLINPSEWISQSEAAKIRNVSRQAISKLIRNGRLIHIKVAGHILVNRFDVENFQPLDPGRPRTNIDE